VRVYVLEGFQLVPKDADDSNNPYISITLGKKTTKDVNETKQATSRPQFYKCYELRCSFPEETLLTVGVWDWDKASTDDLIGETKIDLENRFYNKEWKSMKFHPIEYRTLWTPSSTNPQGQWKMWVDVLTVDEASKIPIEDIQPPIPLPYELRVIVWETKEVAFKDKTMSDIFVAGYPEGQDPQVTDTHWRSEDGIGLFNWRMKFPLTVPSAIPKFKLQVWDKDVLKPNDAICEANLNLRPFYMKVWKNKMNRDSLAQQWITMTHPNASGPMGKVMVSFELMTLTEAASNPAGLGRGEPNSNPHLDEPKRPETSINPLRVDKMFTKVLIGQNKGKIALIAGVVICIILTIIIIYLSIVFR